MEFRATIHKGNIEFASTKSLPKLRQYEGADIIITIDDKPSANMRRFFEGAVVPYVFYQLPQSGWKTFKDCREALKLEFIPAYVTTVRGERLKTARSTADLSKERFTRFLDLVTSWMAEQGMEVPDHIDFNAWKNSAPAKGEEYPPVKRMRLNYLEQTGKIK